MCRKRPLCQGQALRAAYAGLDMRGRASGVKYKRATDEDAAGGGSVKGYIHSKFKKAKGRKHSCHAHQPAAFPLTSYSQDTNKFSQSHQRNFCGIPSLSNPIRVADEKFISSTIASDTAKIHKAQNQNAVNAADGCLRSIAAMPISCWQFACPMLAAYRQNAMRIYVANLPDVAISHISFRKHAFPFVQANLRRPAYVSSIRCAYSLTAGEGQAPSNPKRHKRQERQ